MEGKEAIIAKILSDANKKAEEVLSAADAYAVKVKEEADEWAKNYLAEQQSLLKEDCAEVVKRRNIGAELDVKKNILSAKQQVVDEVYALATEKLCALSKKDYLALVEKLLIRFADKGDSVVLSRDGVLTEKDVTALAVFGERELKTAKITGDFKGGVKLVGKTSDKDLSFSAVVAAEKQTTVRETAEKLFG